MKVTFEYNQEKDTWCLTNYGKRSNNSSSSTKTYEKLILNYGENPTDVSIAAFINEYITSNKIDVEESVAKYQSDWSDISDEYQKRAEALFQVSLPNDVIAYLTVNNRCPYNIKESFFFVSFPTASSRKVAMHELWHFYTWYKFGVIWEDKIGKQKYNDIKEALTVLINIECADLLPERIYDIGYPQHKELRERIVKLWTAEKDMNKLWNNLVS